MNWLMSMERAATQVRAPICGNGNCEAGQWQRWNRRRQGVSLNSRWFCSEECFVEALAFFLERIPSQRETRPASAHRLPLGLLMLSRGAIDEEQLSSALSLQEQAPRHKIGECLVRLGAVGENEVTRALGAQHCLPVLVAYEPEPDWRIPYRLQDVSEAVCLRSQHIADLVYVGFASAVDMTLVRAIAMVLSVKAEPCIVPSYAVVDRLSAMEDQPRPSEMVFEARMPNPDIVRSIVSYVRQTACERLKVANTRRYIWAKLEGHRNESDLLFRIA